METWGIRLFNIPSGNFFCRDEIRSMHISFRGNADDRFRTSHIIALIKRYYWWRLLSSTLSQSKDGYWLNNASIRGKQIAQYPNVLRLGMALGDDFD